MIQKVEAYVIVCDECGKKWPYGDDEYRIDVDRDSLDGWWNGGEESIEYRCDGWQEIDGRHLCPADREDDE